MESICKSADYLLIMSVWCRVAVVLSFCGSSKEPANFTNPEKSCTGSTVSGRSTPHCSALFLVKPYPFPPLNPLQLEACPPQPKWPDYSPPPLPSLVIQGMTSPVGFSFQDFGQAGMSGRDPGKKEGEIWDQGLEWHLSPLSQMRTMWAMFSNRKKPQAVQVLLYCQSVLMGNTRTRSSSKGTTTWGKHEQYGCFHQYFWP